MGQETALALREDAETLPDCVQNEIASIHQKLDARISEAIKDCESPIEQMFALGLVDNEKRFPDVQWSCQQTFDVFRHTYRVDFILEIYDVIFHKKIPVPICDWTTQLIVECDGMEYHSDTERIESDNTRDIDFLMRYNIPTIRFTGRQILKDPWGCAGRALQLVTGMNADKRREQTAVIKGLRFADAQWVKDSEGKSSK